MILNEIIFINFAVLFIERNNNYSVLCGRRNSRFPAADNIILFNM